MEDAQAATGHAQSEIPACCKDGSEHLGRCTAPSSDQAPGLCVPSALGKQHGEQQSHSLWLTDAPSTSSCVVAVRMAGHRRRASSRFYTEQGHAEV